LVNQLRRASISICSNLAEGISPRTNKERAKFTGISFGSALEVLNQLIISSDLGYISVDELKDIRIKIEGITNKLNSLYVSQTGKTHHP
jgi:four helix bundle protein